MAPNRVVAIAASVLSLALAVLPVVGNFDWTSTAGVLAGITAVLTVSVKWLDGHQKHEARVALAPAVAPSVDDPVADEPVPLNAVPVAP